MAIHKEEDKSVIIGYFYACCPYCRNILTQGKLRIVFFRAPSKWIYARVYERVQLGKYESALEIYNESVVSRVGIFESYVIIDVWCYFMAILYHCTNPFYRKMRELVKDGVVGDIKRVNWLITDWYRSQSYYDSGSWRATCAGEGGGVLFNQCPHQLDLLQWITGMMPKKIRAFRRCGGANKAHGARRLQAIILYI